MTLWYPNKHTSRLGVKFFYSSTYRDLFYKITGRIVISTFLYKINLFYILFSLYFTKLALMFSTVTLQWKLGFSKWATCPPKILHLKDPKTAKLRIRVPSQNLQNESGKLFWYGLLSKISFTFCQNFYL